MHTLARLVWHGFAVIGLLALAAGAALWYSGIGTRTPPGALEAGAARLLRHSMIPASARHRVNPEPSTPESVREGMAHWADHCALCHANDGSGNTPIGQALYPPAPDMRQEATQRLTDGELFYIIENGVKMTGMPAWGTGTPDGERSSWRLVHFIRRLPTLTDAELIEMEELNPRSAAEWRALEEERRFLSGETPPGEPPPSPHIHKGATP